MRVLCKERRGHVWRSVRIMPRTLKEAYDVAQKMSKVPNFLGNQPPEVLVQKNTAAFLVDGVGILYAADIREGESAHVHMTFWDGVLRGREELVHRTAGVVMQAFNLDHVWTAIPKSMPRVVAFTKRAGFFPFFEDDNLVALRLDRRN